MRSDAIMRKVLLPAAILLAAASVSATQITVDSVIAEMNVRRAGAGLPPLQHDKRLDEAASDRVHEMEEQEYWAHRSPDGGHSPFDWIRPRGYDFYMAGENLAAGFETAEVMVDGWMESKGHRANIMSPAYVDCGVAVIEGSTTGRARGWSVVVLFARPHSSSEPASPDLRRVSTQASRQ